MEPIKIAKDTYAFMLQNLEEEIFEGSFPLKYGMNYNSFLIKTGGKNILLDNADKTVKDSFLRSVKDFLQGEKLDYLIVHHLEPDHTCCIEEILKDNPGITLITSTLGLNIMKRFFSLENLAFETHLIKDGEHFNIGDHEFLFLTTSMVHWPEVFFTFDMTSGVLFSADAFGAFGATYDRPFADQYHYEKELLDEARRYYTNIVGKYGPQVMMALAKTKDLSIKVIAPLHGVIFRDEKNITFIVNKYVTWATYGKEKDGYLIIYASIYGHTKEVANLVNQRLLLKGKSTKLIDLVHEHVSYALSESFVYDKIILLAPTFNMGLFPAMENYLLDYHAHLIKNRTFYIMENGSWAPQAARLMKELLEKQPGNKVFDKTYLITSKHKKEDDSRLDDFISQILNDK